MSLLRKSGICIMSANLPVLGTFLPSLSTTLPRGLPASSRMSGTNFKDRKHHGEVTYERLVNKLCDY